MRKILLSLAILCIAAAPVRSQAATNELLMSTLVFGFTFPALPVMLDMADLYGVTGLAMGGTLSYYAFLDNGEYFLYGVPILVSAVYLIRYDEKMEPLTLWLTNGAVFTAASFVAMPLTEWDRDSRIQLRPFPGGATLRYRF